MNKKVVATLVVLLVLVVGVYGVYRVYNHFKRLTVSPVAQTTTETQSGSPSTTLGSLKDLIAKGIAQTCNYNSDKTQGTIYMDGGKVSGDIDTMVGSVDTKSHLIIADKVIYMWSDGKNVGFKMDYDPSASPAPAGTTTKNASGALDPNTQMNYSCSPWIVDGSKFTVPTDVKFSSISLPAKPAAGTPAAGSASSNCSYCDSLTGTEKTQCLTALKCN